MSDIYNHKYGSWLRYRDLLSSMRRPNKWYEIDIWIKTIEMDYRGYTYQTIASDFNEDIYEVIGIKQSQNVKKKKLYII